MKGYQRNTGIYTLLQRKERSNMWPFLYTRAFPCFGLFVLLQLCNTNKRISSTTYVFISYLLLFISNFFKNKGSKPPNKDFFWLWCNRLAQTSVILYWATATKRYTFSAGDRELPNSPEVGQSSSTTETRINCIPHEIFVLIWTFWSQICILCKDFVFGHCYFPEGKLLGSRS